MSKSHQLETSSGLLPAALLPTEDFIAPATGHEAEPLQDLILRVNGGSRAHLGVPASLVWRWACLCGRFGPELQTFIANVLRGTGNVDHFLVRPAARDHHTHDHGLLECSIHAAELALNADHQPAHWQALPQAVADLEQVCAALAFLFDVGKVFEPEPGFDRPRVLRPTLTPHTDLPRCWRVAWRELNRHNPVLAAWMHHVARTGPFSTGPVRAAHELVSHAVTAAWGVRVRQLF